MIDIYKSYSDYHFHVEIGKIISTHSENKRDIRDVVNSLVPWEETKTMGDLGCGYGWFEEKLEGSFDLVIGIDGLAENGPPFMQSVKGLAREAIFKTVNLPAPIELPPASLDLIVSAYSLYFFPDVLPEVKRLIRPEGVLVVITHSERMLEEGERYFDFRNLRKIIENFSAENGGEILRKHFDNITNVEYRNNLIFRRGEEKDLERYIEFKKEFIRKDVDPDIVKTTMIQELARKGEIRLNKDDRIFLVKK